MTKGHAESYALEVAHGEREVGSPTTDVDAKLAEVESAVRQLSGLLSETASRGAVVAKLSELAEYVKSGEPSTAEIPVARRLREASPTAASLARNKEALRDETADAVEAAVHDALISSRGGRASGDSPRGPEFLIDYHFDTQKDLLIFSVVSAVAHRLESVSEEDLVSIDPKQVAERAAGLIPTPHPFAQLGPFYPTSAVTKWLGVSRQALDHRVKARKMLGCPTSDGGQRVYPVWQFTTDGRTIPFLAEVLDTLHHGIDDPWSWATWLVAPVAGRFDGKPAYQWLASGRDPESVLAEARRTASRLAH